MQLELDLKKSVEENAEVYFEKSKKAKRKLDGINEVIEKSKSQLEDAKGEFAEAEKKAVANREKEEKKKLAKARQQWYEKFRWFMSSEGFLVVGGRDATSNEVLIKKHADSSDVVFHTDMAGSPFFIIKADSNPDHGKTPTEKTMQEVADATCAYSRAWKLGLSTSEVFWVKPGQVSKTAQSGEYLGKGAFMIRGKTNYIKPRMDMAIGVLEDGRLMGAPLSAVQANCSKHVSVAQGNEKASAVAKRIKAKIGGELDDIIRVLPAGGCKLSKK